MLEDLHRDMPLLERLGLRTREGNAPDVIRAIYAAAKETPVVGNLLKPADAAWQALNAGDNPTVQQQFEQLYSVGNQTHEQVTLLIAMAEAVYRGQDAVREALAALGERLDPGDVTAFAKATALTAYRSRVAREHQFVDHRGIEGGARRERASSLPFDDVYVTPRLVAERERTPVQERARDLLHQLTRRRDDLGQGELAKLEMEYLELTGAPWRSGPKAGQGGEVLGEALAGTRHAVVIGSPGVGKSALSRFLARVCALGGDAVREWLGWDEDLLPLLVPLATFADARRERKHLSLRQFVRDRMRERGGEALAAAVDDELAAGRAFVLLDGVDEIPEAAERVAVVRAVEEFMTDLGANRFLVTSRPFGYERLKGDIAHFQLPNFIRDQVDEFVHKRQRAIERQQHGDAADMDRAEADADALLEEIRRNPKVTELASNPLMLVIVSIIRYEHARLPQERVQLYERAVKTLMDTWNYCRSEVGIGGTTLSTDRLIRVWGAVAEWTRRTTNTGVMHRAELKRKLVEILTEREYDEDDPEATAESYLMVVTQRAGLLEERGPGIFAFWHSTFEEFLAAVDLATPVRTVIPRLLSVCDDPRWREVVLLAVGYIGVVQRAPETATEIVEAFLEQNVPAIEPVLYPRLRLAAACAADDAGVERSVTERILCSLIRVLQHQPYNHFVKAFVRVVGSRPKFRLSRSVIPDFGALVPHESWEVREQVSRLFSNLTLDFPEVLPFCNIFLMDPMPSVRLHAAIGLAQAGDLRDAVLKEIPNFRKVLGYHDPAEEFISTAPDEAISSLLRMLHSSDERSRLDASELLDSMDEANEAVTTTLEHLLGSAHHSIVFRASDLLWRRSQLIDKVVQALITILETEDVFLQVAVEHLLLQISEEEDYVEVAAVGMLESSDEWLRLQGADLLQKMNRLENWVVDVLEDLLGSDSADVVCHSAVLLWELGTEWVIGILHEVLNGPYDDLRFRAVEVLWETEERSEAIENALLALIESGDPYFRLQSAKRLYHTGAKHAQLAIATLRDLSEEPAGGYRFDAAMTLYTIKEVDEQVEKLCFRLLGSEREWDRHRALQLITEHHLASPSGVRRIIECACDAPDEMTMILEKLKANEAALGFNEIATLADVVKVDPLQSHLRRGARECLFLLLMQHFDSSGHRLRRGI